MDIYKIIQEHLDKNNDPLRDYPNRAEMHSVINAELKTISDSLQSDELNNTDKEKLLGDVFQLFQLKYGFSSVSHQYNKIYTSTRPRDISYEMVSEVLNRAINNL